MTNHPNRGKRSRKGPELLARQFGAFGGYPKLTYRRGWTSEMEEPCKPVEAYNAREAMKLLGIEDVRWLQVLENGSWIWVA